MNLTKTTKKTRTTSTKSENINDVERTYESIEEVEKVSFKVRGTEETFWQIYTELLFLMESKSSPSAAAKRVFCNITRKCNGQGEIALLKVKKDEIANDLDISQNVMKQYIKELVTSQWLIKISRAVYAINPKYAWKGSIENRNKQIVFLMSNHGLS